MGDAYFLKKNNGKEQDFLGESTCKFMGKDMPCFLMEKKGSITTEILRDTLTTLDKFEVYSHT